jgi:hypothetical protein
MNSMKGYNDIEEPKRGVSVKRLTINVSDSCFVGQNTLTRLNIVYGKYKYITEINFDAIEAK